MRFLTVGKARLVVGFLACASSGCSLLADLSQFSGDVPAQSDAGGTGSGSGGVDSIAPDGAQGLDGSQAPDGLEGPDAPPESGAQADSSSDGAAIDSPKADAGADGPNPLLGTSYCSANIDKATLLCADYDEGRADNFLTFPIDTEWSPYQNGGTAGINRADYAPGSAPASLIVNTVCTGSTTGCTPNYTQDQFTASVAAGTGIVFSLSLKILNFDLNAPDVSLFDVATSAWRVSLDLSSAAGSGSELYEFHPLVNNTAINNPISLPSFTGTCDDAGAGDDAGCDGVWVDIVLTIDLVGTTAACAGGPCITLTYDGVNAFLNGTTAAPISPPQPFGDSLTVLIGANYISAPAQPMTLEYDNVKVEALP